MKQCGASLARLSLATLLLTVLSSSVDGRKCYTCSSTFNAECSDSSRISSLYQTCPGDQDQCLKIVGPGNVLTRSCGVSTTQDQCLNMGNIQTCSCPKDYCNASSRFNSFLPLALFSVVAGLAANKLVHLL